MKKALYLLFILSNLFYFPNCSSNLGIDAPNGIDLAIKYEENNKNTIVFDMKWVDDTFILREDVFDFLVYSATKLKDKYFLRVEFAFDGESRIYAMREAFLGIKNRTGFYKNLKKMNGKPFFNLKYLDDSELTMNLFIGEWFWKDIKF